MNTPLPPKNMDDNNAQFELDQSESYGVGGFLWEIIKVFILSFVIIIPIRVFFFQPFFVQGSSMEPNFQDGEYLIVGEFGYKKTDIDIFGDNVASMKPFKVLNRQDIVVFHPPISQNSGQFFIKRVIGLPGETISIDNSHITIRNSSHPEGFLLDEHEYLSPSVPTFPSNGDTSFSVKLAEDEYFLLGDNRLYSRDSRIFGPVKMDKVIGKVLLRAWPVDRAQMY